MKNVHAIEPVDNDAEEEEAKPLNSERHEKEGVMPAEHTKKVLLCEDVPGRTVTISKGIEEGLETIKMSSHGPRLIYVGSVEKSWSTRSK